MECGWGTQPADVIPPGPLWASCSRENSLYLCHGLVHAGLLEVFSPPTVDPSHELLSLLHLRG